MKIALAQMKVVAGNIEKNRSKMRQFVEEAKDKGADLIAFPEMCTQGYLVGDNWLRDEFCRISADIAQDLIEASSGIAIAWGAVFLDEELGTRTNSNGYHPSRDGRTRRYNAVHVVQNQQYVTRKAPSKLLPPGVVPKTLLPNYRIFDDQRYFFSLKNIAEDFGVSLQSLVQPLMIKERGGKEVPILFQVCEDMWAKDYRAGNESLNVTRLGINNGAELVINLSSSPWTHGKNGARDRRIQELHADQEKPGNEQPFKPFFYVNCVGVQNNGKNFVTFDGGSTIYNSDGNPVKLASSPYQEELIVVDTDELSDLQPVAREEKSPIAEKYQAIIQGIQSLQDVINSAEPPKFVIGLSGGVDSAVVAALLTKAVGKERIIGINMPTQWNSEATKNAAASLAEALGIDDYRIIPISNMVDSVERALTEQNTHHSNGDNDSTTNVLSPLAQENIQAKIRGTCVLSNIAGNEGRLFTNNGNKLETALGYATLYGDIGGSIAPIGDLLKTEVFEMARYLNDTVFEKEVIPNALIPDALYQFSDDQIEPSAELKEAQVDPMKFGYHDALLALATDYRKWGEERILSAYSEGTLHQHIAKALGKEDPQYGLELMQRWGVDKADLFIDDLKWFFSTVERNVFKRVQAPGIVITSKSSYGYDIRESMGLYLESPRTLELRAGLKDYHASD